MPDFYVFGCCYVDVGVGWVFWVLLDGVVYDVVFFEVVTYCLYYHVIVVFLVLGGF